MAVEYRFKNLLILSHQLVWQGNFLWEKSFPPSPRSLQLLFARKMQSSPRLSGMKQTKMRIASSKIKGKTNCLKIPQNGSRSNKFMKFNTTNCLNFLIAKVTRLLSSISSCAISSSTFTGKIQLSNSWVILDISRRFHVEECSEGMPIPLLGSTASWKTRESSILD